MIYLVAFRNIFRNIRRSLTIVVTISIGIAALFLFHGFNVGTANQYREDMIHSRFAHGQINVAGYRENIFDKPWLHWIPDSRLLTTKLREQSFVAEVFPRVEFYGLVASGAKTISAKGQAVDGPAESRFFTTLNIVQGQNLSTESDGIILGEGIARALAVKPGDLVSVLGNTIHGSINGLDLTVVGVFHTGIKEFDDNYFRIQLENGLKLLDAATIESVSVGLRPGHTFKEVQDFLAVNFSNLEGTSFEVLDKVYYQNTVDWLQAQFEFIQAIILFIVFLGILNTVSTTILERKQEIGNLRANGESQFQIIKLLLLEGTFLGTLGSGLGLLVAVGLTWTVFKNGIVMPPGPGQTRNFITLIELQSDMALRAFVFGIATSMIGTIIAASRVLRLSIREALRGI